VTQDVDVQLKVWKDLAISKQILMGAATDALGLDAECSTEELKEALDKAIKRARDADINIQETRSQADQQIAEYKQRAESADEARKEAETSATEAIKAREQAEQQLARGKEDNSAALKKARAEVAEKQSQLKAISKSLADTPENVVRKLKTLKKQKLDESKLRTQTENKLQSTRKQLAKIEAELEQGKATLEAALKLAPQIRELHQACSAAAEAIAKLSDKKKDQVEVPDLDLDALDVLEQAAAEK
jgi:colicin import membrane protein